MPNLTTPQGGSPGATPNGSPANPAGAGEIVHVSREQIDKIKTELQQLRAWKLENERNIGRPGFLYQSVSDMKEKREHAAHVLQWWKAVHRNDHNLIEKCHADAPEFYLTHANFNEGDANQGGTLVPVILDTIIHTNANRYGVARKLYRNYPMTSNQHTLNRGSAITAAVVGEGTQATEQDATGFFTPTTLTAKRISAAYIATEEELDDVQAEFVEYMARELGRGIAKSEDTYAFSSASTIIGLLKTSGVTAVNMAAGKTSIADISWRHLIDLQQSVTTESLQNAIYLINRTGFAYLRKETDTGSTTTGRPIWDMIQPMPTAGQEGLDGLEKSTFWTPLGYPMVVVPDDVWTTDAVSTGCVAFGDFSEYAYMGTKKGLTAKTYNEIYRSTTIPGGGQALEMSERIGFAYPVPAAFAVLKTAAS